MLQLYKNRVVTSVAKDQIDLAQMELDWYTNNLWTLSQQAAVLAGFAYVQLTSALPPGAASKTLCWAYITIVSMSLGSQLCVVVTATLCTIWGPGLALRGTKGSRSVHEAITNLRIEQTFVFSFFVLGMGTFILSNILQIWCSFHPLMATAATVVLTPLGVIMLLSILVLTVKLRIDDHAAASTRVEALRPYEDIQDLDTSAQHYPVHLTNR